MRFWLWIGGISGLLGVILGAFGAHGVEEAIPGWYTVEDLPEKSNSPANDVRDGNSDAQQPEWYRLHQLHLEKLRTWKTGVRYHFYHALALLIVGTLFLFEQKCWPLNVSAWLFLLGTIWFSGSLYLYVLSKIKIFGMTAAIGGTLFILGWIFFLTGISKITIPRIPE